MRLVGRYSRPPRTPSPSWTRALLCRGRTPCSQSSSSMHRVSRNWSRRWGRHAASTYMLILHLHSDMMAWVSSLSLQFKGQSWWTVDSKHYRQVKLCSRCNQWWTPFPTSSNTSWESNSSRSLAYLQTCRCTLLKAWGRAVLIAIGCRRWHGWRIISLRWCLVQMTPPPFSTAK